MPYENDIKSRKERQESFREVSDSFIELYNENCPMESCIKSLNAIAESDNVDPKDYEPIIAKIFQMLAVPAMPVDLAQGVIEVLLLRLKRLSECDGINFNAERRLWEYPDGSTRMAHHEERERRKRNETTGSNV